MKRLSKTQWSAAGCVIGSMVLYVTLTITADPVPLVSESGQIQREAYGGDEKQYQLFVEGLEEDPVPLTVMVGARAYTKETAAEVFEVIMDGMEERIRGENPSLMEVSRNLILPGQADEYGVRLRWTSSNSEVLDTSGSLHLEHVDAEMTLYLGVRLLADSYQQDYEIPVRVIPDIRREQETGAERLNGEIKKREERQRTEQYLSLPVEYEGKTLHYRTEEDSGYTVLLVLGVLLAILCYAKDQADAREREKKRERELLLDYAELLSKLMILIGAGLTVRGAWERMVHDYEAAVKQGRQPVRAAYEEMTQTCHQLQSGLSEGEAYREFGRRCRLQPYLKLSSLLEQNRKTGIKNLREILRTEMSDAFEQRKNLARRLGEEAGTRLLLPLFLMLGIVMVMIMVPAMMTMG